MLEGGMKRKARMIKCLLVWFEVSTHIYDYFYFFPLLGYAYLEKRFSGSDISAINFICG